MPSFLFAAVSTNKVTRGSFGCITASVLCNRPARRCLGSNIHFAGGVDFFLLSFSGARFLSWQNRTRFDLVTSRPSGNLITSTQRLPQKHDVVFFEKNGLRHGEFSLREECRVIELAWNSDSSLLALSLEKPDGYFGKSNPSQILDFLTILSPKNFHLSPAVQLWSMNNYHYYMKHEISYPAGVALTSMCWDPESPYSLHVTLDDGHYVNYEFCWDTYSSSSLSVENAGTVAVVDGGECHLF